MKSFPLLSHISIVSTLIGLTYDLKGLFKLQFKSFSPLFKSHSLEYYVLSYYRRLWRGFAKAEVINVDLKRRKWYPKLTVGYSISKKLKKLVTESWSWSYNMTHTVWRPGTGLLRTTMSSPSLILESLVPVLTVVAYVLVFCPRSSYLVTKHL